MERLFTAWKLKNLEIQNRICVPPMVCFGWSDESGMVVDRNVEHYRAMAKGGPGLIIQEATCVSENGRLSRDQLGIWSDAHVRGLSGSWRQSTERASLCFYRSITPGWCLKQRIPYVPAIIPWSLREGSAMGGSFLWRRSRRSKGIS